MRYAFAFAETMTQADGERLIIVMRGTIAGDRPRAVEWPHDSLPSLTANSAPYQVPQTWPDLTFHQHPRYRVIRV